MHAFRIILSIAALLIAAAGVAQTSGVIPISNETATLLLSLSGLMGVMGVSPLKVSPNTAKVLSGLSMVTIAFGPVHASGHLSFVPQAVMHAIGILGTLMGVAGRSFLRSTPRTSKQKPPKTQ